MKIFSKILITSLAALMLFSHTDALCKARAQKETAEERRSSLADERTAIITKLLVAAIAAGVTDRAGRWIGVGGGYMSGIHAGTILVTLGSIAESIGIKDLGFRAMVGTLTVGATLSGFMQDTIVPNLPFGLGERLAGGGEVARMLEFLALYKVAERIYEKHLQEKVLDPIAYLENDDEELEEYEI